MLHTCVRPMIKCLLILCASGSLLAQPSDSYRMVKDAGLAYKVDTQQGKLSFVPVKAAGTHISLTCRKCPEEKDPNALNGAVSMLESAPGGGSSLNYLGTQNTLFQLLDGDTRVSFAYPDVDVNLELVFSAVSNRISLKSAKYTGGCSNPISSLADRYLQSWVEKFPKEIAVRPGEHMSVQITHPSDKMAPQFQEKETLRSSCASIFMKQDPHDLTVYSVPPKSTVYVHGQFAGMAGDVIKVRETPAELLVRHEGCEDFAKTISLHDGSNEVNVTLGGCPK